MTDISKVTRMKANYHTHTWRCHHAAGAEREYVEDAIAGGIDILGFSDHTPQFYPDGFTDPYKMKPDQLKGYVDTVLKLKEEYKNQISLHLGLEVEYLPAYFDELIRFISDFPIEYFILGQHYLGNEINDVFSADPTDDPDVLDRYVKQCEEAMDTGRFTYLAHPDLINFTGGETVYVRLMRNLCEHAKSRHIPLEINFLGIWGKRNYPNQVFWHIAGEVGNEVIFGADAHQPDKVWNPKAFAFAQWMVDQHHLNRIETVRLIDPRDH